MHEVGFAAANGGLDITAVRYRILKKSLLTLVDQGHRHKKAHCYTEIGDED